MAAACLYLCFTERERETLMLWMVLHTLKEKDEDKDSVYWLINRIISQKLRYCGITECYFDISACSFFPPQRTQMSQLYHDHFKSTTQFFCLRGLIIFKADASANLIYHGFHLTLKAMMRMTRSEHRRKLAHR